MTDQTRAAFEAHFQLTQRQAWQHPDGSYKFPEIQAKWEGYLAGVAKAAPVAEQEPIGKVCVFRDTADGDVFDIATTGEQRERIMQMDGMPIYAAPVAAAAPVAVQRRCKQCHAPRKDETCQKCGEPTFVPHPSWEEPELPPVDRIRELACEVGYALGEHGTKERDLDLIAAPWTDDAIGNHALMQHIAKGLGANIVSIERKPQGRYACTIQMDGYYKPIDLSICSDDR